MNLQLTQRRIFAAQLALALLTGTLPVVSDAQDMGKLFTTADEREYLDYLRQDFVTKSQLSTFNIQEAVIPDIPDTEPQQAAAPQVVEYRFGGVMALSNGKRMVWLNGKQTPEGDLPRNMGLVNAANGTTLLNIRANGTTYQLKPGQTVSIRNSDSQGAVQATTTSQVAATATAPPVGTPPAAVPPATTSTRAEQTRELAGTAANQESDLGTVIAGLSTDAAPLTDDQLQQALEILTEQANAQQ